MVPTLIDIGPLTINSFGLMVALCFFGAFFRLSISFENNGIDPKLADRYVLVAGIVGLIGARFWYVFIDFPPPSGEVMEALTSNAGFTFHGGFLTSLVAVLAMAKFDRIPLTKFADSVGPTLTLCYMVGRLGCQLAGDGDYGIETLSWLGMTFENGAIATPPGVFVYPTPFYESLWCFFILLFLARIETRPFWMKPLRRCGVYLCLISIERFVVEFIRVNPHYAYGLSQSQLVYIGVCLGGIILMLSSQRLGKIT